MKKRFYDIKLYSIPLLFHSCLLLFAPSISAQSGYMDSLKQYRASYVEEHEVIKADDKPGFRFFPINESARVLARFEKAAGTELLQMGTSSGGKKTFRIYGYAHFQWEGVSCKLTIYQSQSLLGMEQYKDYLFLPFTDASNEDSTYESGRYLDLRLSNIAGDIISIDFNKAYNPYCAYVSDQYNCPIPPKENSLPVRLEAGEKRFSKR